MKRREFIAGVGFAALGGAAGVGGVGCSPQKTGQMQDPVAASSAGYDASPLRKAVMLGMVDDPVCKSTYDRFLLLRDLGFEGVEVDWPSAISTDEYAHAQEKSGLHIHGIVNSQHWKSFLNHGSSEVRKAGLDTLLDCLGAAKTLGAGTVLLVPGVVNANNSYDECWRLSQQQINAAIPLARENGIVIAIENVWNGFLLSPLEAARYIDDFNSPWVKHYFDIGNIINFGWPHHWVRILGPRIAKVHIKDFSRRKRDEQGLWKGFDVELGEGDAGWPKVMLALKQVGYTQRDARGAWATAEVRGGNRARLAQVAAQMQTLLSSSD